MARLSLTRPPVQGFDDVSVATIGLGVLQALEYMHNNGQIHRDVKAGPLLCSCSGETHRWMQGALWAGVLLASTLVVQHNAQGQRPEPGSAARLRQHARPRARIAVAAANRLN